MDSTLQPCLGQLMDHDDRPTESESKEEIDRFCDALISIKDEILKIAQGNTINLTIH